MLSTLSKGTNIHGLNLKELKIDPHKEILGRYEDLKKLLQEESSGLWYHRLSDNLRTQKNDQTCQLIAILLELEIDRRKGTNYQKQLTEIGFFKQSLLNEEIQLNDCLLTLLIDHAKYGGISKMSFAALKNFQHFDNEKKQWMNSLYDSIRSSEDQLLAVIVESKFNREVGETIFKDLKNSPFFNVNDNEWNHAISEKSQAPVSTRTTNSQLWAILVEIEFSPQTAKNRFLELKASPFFNDNKNLWCRYSSDLVPDIDNQFWTEDQLLGILIELRLHKKLDKNEKIEDFVELPPVRNF